MLGALQQCGVCCVTKPACRHACAMMSRQESSAQQPLDSRLDAGEGSLLEAHPGAWSLANGWTSSPQHAWQQLADNMACIFPGRGCEAKHRRSLAPRWARGDSAQLAGMGMKLWEGDALAQQFDVFHHRVHQVRDWAHLHKCLKISGQGYYQFRAVSTGQKQSASPLQWQRSICIVVRG